MNKAIWFSGERSFIPDGAAPKLGDGDLVLSFDRPKELPWREDDWFCVDLKVVQDSDVRFSAWFYEKDRADPMTLAFELLPGVRLTYRVGVKELWNLRFFLEPFPGSYKGHARGWPMDPAKVERVELHLMPGRDLQSAVLYGVYASDAEPDTLPEAKKLVDEMGQLIGREWSTKTHSVGEMVERLHRDYDEAKAAGDAMRPGFSRFGGYLAKQFEGTGWFRTHHDGKRWWLVDPDGYAFFSHGVCYGTRMGEFGWFTGLEDFYTDPPAPDDPVYREAFTQPKYIAEYVKRHGTTGRSDNLMFNPARANMMKAFGSDWWEAWRAINAHRFRKWGFNTTGIGIVNFIDEHMEDYLRLSRMPYVVTLKRFPKTKHFIFRDFPDVFSPEYAENCRIFAANELKPLAGDPYLLGYFLHNEPEWMFQSDYCVALELLCHEEPLESRADMQRWLRERYHEDLAAMNAAWGTAFASWEELLRPVSRDVRLSDAAKKDLDDYEQVLIMAFGKIPLDACREVDPNHLCLGLRHGAFTACPKVVDGSAIFDVFSFNCYRTSPMPSLEMAERAGKPCIIGEWHFGGQDIGLYRTALLSCTDQKERAKAYRHYLEEAAACPWCVGAHYFEYNDQTVMGRFDGEHMAHGLIDCTNKPYPDMERAITATSDVLYQVLTGEREPFAETFEMLSPHW